MTNGTSNNCNVQLFSRVFDRLEEFQLTAGISTQPERSDQPSLIQETHFPHKSVVDGIVILNIFDIFKNKLKHKYFCLFFLIRSFPQTF